MSSLLFQRLNHHHKRCLSTSSSLLRWNPLARWRGPTHYGNTDLRRTGMQKQFSHDHLRFEDPPGFRFKQQGIKRTWLSKDDRIANDNPYANKSLTVEEQKKLSEVRRIFRNDKGNYHQKGIARRIYDSRGWILQDRVFRQLQKNQTARWNIFQYYPFNMPDIGVSGGTSSEFSETFWNNF